MTAQPKRSWTVEEYLTFERSSNVKHEYVAGDVFAMAGATATHNIIVANIIASLHAQTRQRDCTVFPSDMRLKIVSYNSYTYPDVTVVCGEFAMRTKIRTHFSIRHLSSKRFLLPPNSMIVVENRNIIGLFLH